MYPEKARHATCLGAGLCLLELRVTLDKLLCAASWEANGYTAVFVVALYADNGSNAEARMTNFAPQHGIGIAAAFCGGASERSLGGLAARGGRCLLGSAPPPAEEFFRGIRILLVRPISAWRPHFP